MQTADSSQKFTPDGHNGSLTRKRSIRIKGPMSYYTATKRGVKSSARLLVVNADPEDRYTLLEALQADAYEIVFCDSLDTRESHQLDDRPFEACIIGFNHPVEACFDLLATIKNDRPLTEVVILSRLANEELWIESIQRGAYDFLPIPLDRKELQRIVKNAVEKNRRQPP